MQVNQESINFLNVLNQQYLEAVQNGFNGTFGEYCNQTNQKIPEFSDVLNQQYTKAIQEGFKGTFEEYCTYRDYVRE